MGSPVLVVVLFVQFTGGYGVRVITIAARAEGNGAFVFLNSQPWRLWNDIGSAKACRRFDLDSIK